MDVSQSAHAQLAQVGLVCSCVSCCTFSLFNFLNTEVIFSA